MLSFLFFHLAQADTSDDGELDYGEDIEDYLPPVSQPESTPLQVTRPDYNVEILMLGLLLLFLLNFFVGKQKNEKIATDWLYLLKPLFQENFSHTGAAEKEGEGEMMKEAYHVFKYYATGRYNIGYILTTLELAKRQDLFNVVFLSLLFKEQEKVAYEVPIKQESTNPVVMLLCKTSAVKSLRNQYNDVKTLTTVFDVGLPEQYTLLAENSEAASFIVSSSVIRIISALGNSIEFIYISDQLTNNSNYGVLLNASFLYPSSAEQVSFVSIQAQLVIQISDLVSKLSLPSKIKSICEKERVSMNKEKIKEIKQKREEERQQKKYEDQKKKEEKLQNLSIEKKRKLEEKEYKKELKKKGLKFKMIKG